jgi:hypothetical protein
MSTEELLAGEALTRVLMEMRVLMDVNIVPYVP